MSFFERGQRWLSERGKPVWEPAKIYHLRGTPDELFGIRTDSRPFAGRALAAIKEHRSQRQVIFDPEGTDEEWMKVMGRETWVIAWPRWEPGDPMLNDIFAGLD